MNVKYELRIIDAINYLKISWIHQKKDFRVDLGLTFWVCFIIWNDLEFFNFKINSVVKINHSSIKNIWKKS